MAIAGLTIVGRPFAVWPATLQVMPEGIFDAGIGRFFVGVRVSNGSAQAWPAAEIHVSARGRRILAAAGVAISDSWSAGDGAALGQPTTNGEWVPVPALAAAGIQVVFFKLDVSQATPGLHQLELELRDPTAPTVTIKATAPLPIARTTCQGTERTFTSVCDQGTLTASLSAVTMDQESFRRVLGRARALAGSAPPGTRTPAATEKLRLRLRALLCGEESDVCGVLSDLNTTCALPPTAPPGPPPATGLAAAAIVSDQASNLGDRVKITDGSVFSNHAVVIGNDAIINANVTSGGDVQIGDRTRVQGDVNAAGVIRTNQGGGATITGDQNQHAPFTSVTIPTKTVTPGSNNVTVNSNTGTATNPFVIAPGSYGVVTVNSPNVISMSSGTYQMAQLILNADVTLVLNQTTTAADVRVQTNLSFGDRLIIKPGTTTPGVVAQFYSNQTTEVRVGTDIASFSIAVTAPQGTIHVFSRTQIAATLAGKTVTLEPDVGVSRVPTDDWLGTGASGLEFLGYPTGVQLSVAYNGTFFGTTGPLAFGLLSWKALLANAMLQFDLGLPGAVEAELVSTADQAVVGTVKAAVLNAPTTAPGTPPPSTQAGSVDAAVATARGNRSLGSPWFAQLDAAPGEANATPIGTLGGTIFTAGQYLSNADIDGVLANAGTAPNNLKVYKSGAGTGVTRGIISALLPVVARDDETGTLQFINQVLIVPDPAAPPAAGAVAGLGDSGALWVQTGSNKIVGMTHTVGTGGAVVSRFQDVVNALQIQLA